MDYDAILEQVVALLQQQRRLSYRVLKLRLQLDGDTLEALKEDLIYAKHLAVDEDGRVLVWTGASGAVTAPGSGATEPAEPVATTVDQDLRVGSPSPAPRTPEAERRQLTVLFCDLVDSTVLASRLDPEDLREVVRGYQETCAKVIARFEGHIAQYLGDGLLVYFGYPQAHEDDAQRGVRAGLGMVEALGELNARLAVDHGIQLAVRVGIHTGLVVVGAMGTGDRREPLALGETPNVAARLQNLAPPNRIVISASVRQQVGGAFDLEDLGLHTLKGVPAQMRVYGVGGESGAESRFEAASTTLLTPLIGREEEISLVLRRWELANAGEGQVVLLAGEAGIGKSRLTQAVCERLAAEPHFRLQYQCSPYHTHSAFYPIIAQLERAARLARDDPPTRKLDKLEALLAQGTTQVAEVAPLLAALLSLPTGERYPPLSLSPERRKAQTIAALVDQLVGLSCHRPVLFLVEDVHWCDPTTLDVLEQVVNRVADLRVLVLITFRSEFEAPWTASHLTTLTLTRLSRAQVVTIVSQLTAGKAFPTEVLAQILAKTDGIPLYVEELTKTILESGLLREVGKRYTLTGPLPPLAIPATLHDSLMARLDRLAPVKETAQLGAVLGREFTYELLAAVSPLPDQALQEAVAQLVGAGLLFRRGQPPEAQYRFKHALVQEAAYQSLLRSTRQRHHQRIAQVLEARFPGSCETQPELLAHHYTQAGVMAQAISYWRRAGQRAIERSAHAEAIAHLSKGLELLTSLPDTPERLQQELDIQTTLGPALMAAKGFAAPEVLHAYARARELCRQVGETPQLFPVLWGLRAFYAQRAELHIARELAEQLLHLAQRTQDPALLMEAHRALGVTLLWLGELVPAQAHLEQGITLYDSQEHRSLAFRYGEDPGVICRLYAAHLLWYFGYPDQALNRIREALSLAYELAHPFSVAYALYFTAVLHYFRREEQLTQEHTEATITLSAKQGFTFFVARGTMLQGWALVAQRRGAEGMAQMHQGLAAWQATGSEMGRPYALAQMAEAYGKEGQAREGLGVLAEALAAVGRHKELYYEAELYRLQGELLLIQAAGRACSEAETCLQRALGVARRQQAKSLELRAAMSLARLWQRQGKRDEARDLLAPIYGWFSEGFDTADLQEARALLDALASS
jgi:predicted ATPase/class 3 adenylate cyclase